MDSAENITFNEEIIRVLPQLRKAALAMTRNKSAADDLVQNAVLNAISNQDTFLPGSNFAAWTYRILRNRFLSDIRKHRPTVDIDYAPLGSLSVRDRQIDTLITQEVVIAISILPETFQKVLQGVLKYEGEGVYESLSNEWGEPVGTIKSRVSRAREALKALLNGEKPELILRALHEFERKEEETKAALIENSPSKGHGPMSTPAATHPAPA